MTWSRIILSLVMICLLGQCERKNDLLPACIAQRIDQLKKEPVRNPPAEVWRYLYGVKIVYYIPPYCCDQYSQLLDENCGVICAPDGGITGAGDGKCKDFFSVRLDGVLIWKDAR